MLEGPIWKKVMVFAIPLVLTGILQQLFNMADTAVVGQFAGKEAMAAVGSNGHLTGLLVNTFIGISTGIVVVMGNALGAGNREKAAQCVHTGVVFPVISGIIIACVAQLIASKLLTILNVPIEIKPMALTYLRIYMVGLPLIFLYDFESAILRSYGDSRTPLTSLAISGTVNIVLNLILVIIFHLSVAGVAIATVISYGVSTVILLIAITRRESLTIKHSIVEDKVLKQILVIGVPAGLQSAVFSLSNICIQSSINSLGADAMAATAAASQLELLQYSVLFAISQACTAFIGQNYGAGNRKRCRKVTKVCLWQEILSAFAIAVVMIFFSQQLLEIFNNDSNVIRLGKIRLIIILIGTVLNGIIEVYSSTMIGYGNSLSPALCERQALFYIVR